MNTLSTATGNTAECFGLLFDCGVELPKWRGTSLPAARQSFASLLLCAFAFLLLPLCISAATNDLTSVLQRGLFEEEANRNLEAAAQAYRDVSAQFDKDRKVAATAVFRLGEIYRKQGKTNEAVVQYERIVREFSDQEMLATLSRQNLGQQRAASLASNETEPLEQALADALKEHAKLETLVAELKRLPREKRLTVLPTLVPESVDEFLRAQLTNLMLNEPHLIEEMSNYASDDPRAQDAARRLEKYRRAVEAGVNPIMQGLELKLVAVKAQVAQLTKQLDAARQSPRVTAGAGSEVSPPTTDDEDKEIRRIQAMIQNSPDLINSAGEGGVTPLARAASAGWLRVAKFLLENGALVDRISGNSTPLHHATSTGHKAMVELLLERGADVNARDGTGGTALHLAAQKGFLSVAEVLIKHKADLNARNSSQNGERTPLHAAVERGNVALVAYLLANGAGGNVKDSLGKTPLHIAASLGQDTAVESLLKSGADANALDNSKQTPLFSACAGNRPSAVKLLLAVKADPNHVDDNGRTPLSYSVNPRPSRFGGFASQGNSKGSYDLVKVLLGAKADPNAGSADSPLLLAVRADDAEFAEMLLRAGADPNQPTDCQGVNMIPEPNGNRSRHYDRSRVNRTPLQVSVLEDYPAMTKVLLQFKADPKANNPDGQPLVLDTLGKVEILKGFLDAGADPNVTNRYSRTPLHVAAASGQKEIAELLLAYKADVNARDVVGNTPLYWAVDSSSKPIVELLLAKGADPNTANSSGQTPLNRTKSGTTLSEVQIKEIAPLLRQHGALDELPFFDRIEVRRPGFLAVAFPISTNGWNEFSLLELLALHYGFISTDRNAVWEVNKSTVPSQFWGKAACQFPDFSRVVIRRPDRSGPRWMEIPVKAATLLDSGDCAHDVNLQPGDIVEIPEADHPVNEKWAGLPELQRSNLLHCVGRTVSISIKGTPTVLPLAPQLNPTGALGPYGEPMKALTRGSFMLKSVLAQSRLLRASSDMSLVKVTRRVGDKTQEWVLNCGSGSDPDLWLRDGDVIEVPDKP